MDGIIRASSRARATVAAVAIVYFGIALVQGGYATSWVAWGAIALWGAVAIGIILGAWSGGDPPRPAVVAIASLAGLAALSALSLIWADDAGRAFSAILLPAAYAGLVALVVLSFPVIAARTWLLGLVGGTMLTTAIALASRLDPGFLGATDVVILPTAAGRLSYPIGYWNGLAACVAVGAVLLVWLGSQARTREGRAVAIGLLPLGGLALYLTSSRGGVAAVAVGVVVLVALGPGRIRLAAGAALGAVATVGVVLFARGRYDLIHDLGTSAQRSQGLEVALVLIAGAVAIGWVRWWVDERLANLSVPPFARWAGLAALALAVVVGLVLANPFSKVREFASTGDANGAPGQRSLLSASGSGRAQFWEAALDAYGGRPFTGVGAGNYELYWNAHPEAPIVTGNAHSLFLEELADLGPLGLLLALAPFAAALVATRARWRRAPPALAPALAVLLTAAVGATIDWTWKIPASFIPALIAIGLLTGPATLAAGGGGAARRAPTEGGRRFGLGVAALLFAWATVVVAAIVLLATWRLSASRDAVAGGDLAAAASDAREAASIEPFSPEPPLQLALVQELAGDLSHARVSAQEAIDKAPHDWRGWAVASRIDRQAGAKHAADVALFTAQTLSPVPLPREFLRGR